MIASFAAFWRQPRTRSSNSLPLLISGDEAGSHGCILPACPRRACDETETLEEGLAWRYVEANSGIVGYSVTSVDSSIGFGFGTSVKRISGEGLVSVSKLDSRGQAGLLVIAKVLVSSNS